jgi:hypothetical protein
MDDSDKQIIIRPFRAEDQTLVFDIWVDGFSDTTWQGPHMFMMAVQA